MTHRSRSEGRILTIPVGCIEVFHHDEEHYAERGYHLVTNWRYDQFWDDGRVRPDRRRPAQIASNSSISLKDARRWPVKGSVPLKFKCSCGKRKVPNARDLLGIVEHLVQEFGSEAWMDLGRL